MVSSFSLLEWIFYNVIYMNAAMNMSFSARANMYVFPPRSGITGP